MAGRFWRGLAVTAVIAAVLPVVVVAGGSTPEAAAASPCGTAADLVGAPTITPVDAANSPPTDLGLGEEVQVQVPLTACQSLTGAVLTVTLAPGGSTPDWVWVTGSGTPQTISSQLGSATGFTPAPTVSTNLADTGSVADASIGAMTLTAAATPGTVTFSADAVITASAPDNASLTVTAVLGATSQPSATSGAVKVGTVEVPAVSFGTVAETTASLGASVTYNISATVGAGSASKVGTAYNVAITAPTNPNFSVTSTTTSSSNCGSVSTPTVTGTTTFTATWPGAASAQSASTPCKLTLTLTGSFPTSLAAIAAIRQDLAPTGTYTTVGTAAVTTADSTDVTPPTPTITGAYQVAIGSATTAYSFASTQLEVGQVVNATISATFPQGGASHATLLVTAPTGMAFLSSDGTSSSIPDPTNVQFPDNIGAEQTAITTALKSASVTQNGHLLTQATFDFSGVGIINDQAAAGTLSFNLEEVVLCTDATTSGSTVTCPSTVPTAPSGGQVTLHVCDPNNSSACPPNVTAFPSGSISLTAPQVGLGVSISATGVSGNFGDLEPGDVLDINVSLANTGTGTADQIQLGVPVAAGYHLVGSSPCTQDAANQLSGLSCSVSGSIVTVTGDGLAAGSTATVTVPLTASQKEPPPNSATGFSLSYASADPISPLQTTVNADAIPMAFSTTTVDSYSVGVSAPDISLASATTPQVTIGQEFTVSETIDLPQGQPASATSTGFTVTTTLPATLALAGPGLGADCSTAPGPTYSAGVFDGTVTVPSGVTASSTSSPGTAAGFCDAVQAAVASPSTFGTHVASGGQSFSVDFGRVDSSNTNSSCADGTANCGGTVTFTFGVVVLDTTANQAGAGQAQAVQSTVNYTDETGVAQTAQTTGGVTINIVEPSVSVSIAATITTPETKTQTGVEVEYTVTATNPSTDAIPAAGVNAAVVVLASHLSGVTCAPVPGNNCAVSSGRAVFAAPVDLAPGASASLTFTAVLDPATPAGTDLVTDAAASWASLGRSRHAQPVQPGGSAPHGQLRARYRRLSHPTCRRSRHVLREQLQHVDHHVGLARGHRPDPHRRRDCGRPDRRRRAR